MWRGDYRIKLYPDFWVGGSATLVPVLFRGQAYILWVYILLFGAFDFWCLFLSRGPDEKMSRLRPKPSIPECQALCRTLPGIPDFEPQSNLWSKKVMKLASSYSVRWEVERSKGHGYWPPASNAQCCSTSDIDPTSPVPLLGSLRGTQ